MVRYNYRGWTEIGENQWLVQALDYILGFLDAIDKPKVINISLGDNIGPHDGTTTVELAIEANPRLLGRARDMMPAVEDIMRFYASIIGDAPYASATVALVESDLPGASPAPLL